MKATLKASSLKKAVSLANSFFSKMETAKKGYPCAFYLMMPKEPDRQVVAYATTVHPGTKAESIAEFTVEVDTVACSVGDSGQQFIVTSAKMLSKILAKIKKDTVDVASVSKMIVGEDNDNNAAGFAQLNGEDNAEGFVQLDGEIFKPASFGLQYDCALSEDAIDVRDTVGSDRGVSVNVPTIELEILLRNNRLFSMDSKERSAHNGEGYTRLEMEYDGSSNTNNGLKRLTAITTNGHVLAVTSSGAPRWGTIFHEHEFGYELSNIQPIIAVFSKEADTFLSQALKLIKPKQVGLRTAVPKTTSKKDYLGFVGFIMKHPRSGCKFEFYVKNNVKQDNLISIDAVLPDLKNYRSATYNLLELKRWQNFLVMK